MEDNILKFGNDLFVSFKKENINQYYEVIAKVRYRKCRNLGREPSEQSTKAESEAQRGPGEPSKKSQRLKLKISIC